MVQHRLEALETDIDSKSVFGRLPGPEKAEDVELTSNQLDASTPNLELLACAHCQIRR